MLLKLQYCILIFVTCLFCDPVCFCQVIENRFVHYTPKDGLPDGVVTDIKQDSAGYLWIATANGIARFDGHDFKIFRLLPHDTTSICENFITSIYIDSGNRLWFTSFNWLYLYHADGEWFERFQMEGYDLLRIAGEEKGRLILVFRFRGLYKFDIRQKKLYAFDRKRLPNCSTSFYGYFRDDSGYEWIKTSYRLTCYDPVSDEAVRVFGEVGLPIILSDSEMLCAGGGLLLINRKTRAVKQFQADSANSNSLPDNGTNCLYRLNDSSVLVGTCNGLSVFNRKRETFYNIQHCITNQASLSEVNNIINCIFRDREGIIWVGSQHLEKYDFKNYAVQMTPVHMKEQGRKLFGEYGELYRCDDGRFLLGGYRGMGLYDPVSGILTKVDNANLQRPSPNEYRMITAIQDDGHGNIWCTNWPHFSCFGLKGNKVVNMHVYTYPFRFRYGDMKLDNKGHLLTGTLNKGVLLFNIADSSFTIYDSTFQSPAGQFDWRALAVLGSKDGSIWVGTRQGINRIYKNGIDIKHYALNASGAASFTDYAVADIEEDMQGQPWFICDAGLGKINPATDSLSFFGIREGLPTNNYSKICMDEAGNLWAVSKLGILRMNTRTYQSQLYAEPEGFPVPDEIRDIHYSKYSKKLYMLTEYAIYEVDPQSNHYLSPVPTALITGFKVFEKEKSFGVNDKITLNYNENFISISFAALLFHSNEQIKYAYKLDGVDTGWVYCNFRRSASYSDLAPGHYTFNVKAQSPEGTWSNGPTVLQIVIVPPYWQTWWFESLEVILLIAMIIWIGQLYIARRLAEQKIEFEKQNAVSAERNRIAADMHDELGSGLTSIRFLSELASRKLNNDITARSEIEKIESSSARLSENLREIIWTMNTRFDKLEDFIVYVRTYAVEYFDESPIRFSFRSPDTIPEITLNGELRRNVFLCIKEALNNIVKHARCTEASLTFTCSENVMTMEIKDNGIGLNLAEGSRTGNGLNTMNERLKKSGSRLEIEVNGGTLLRFIVRI